MSAQEFAAASLQAPKRTYLDRGRPGSSAKAPGGGAHPPGTASASVVHPAPAPPQDTKAVILAENRVELLDMLHESVAALKNVYRSKFVLGDYLKFVDPSFSGDNVRSFNLAVPPPFDASFGLQEAGQDAALDSAAALGAPFSSGGPSGGAGGDAAMKEKLRTSDELIKKLFRRNMQLETENQYLRSEIVKLERLQGVSRQQTHQLSAEDGHLPLNHPLYTKKLRRTCRSIPPQRTIMRSAVNGFGLTFPPRSGTEATPAAPVEDPLPVAQLKKQCLQLTEALVTVQHDNEMLIRERSDRLSTRDAMLRQYIQEHDSQVAKLYALLQDMMAKVHQPMKLMRAKQPTLGMNPVVVANNILREVAQQLAEQIQSVTEAIVKDTTSSIPPHAAATSARGGPASAGRGAGGGFTGTVSAPGFKWEQAPFGASPGPSGGPSATHPVPTSAMSVATPVVAAITTPSAGGATGVVEAAALDGGGDDDGAGGQLGGLEAASGAGFQRRKDLSRRLRTLVDHLPVVKRKQLLLILVELRELFTALCNSNHVLIGSMDELRSRYNSDVVRLKLQVALLREAIRAAGMDDQAILEAAQLGGSE